MFPVKLAPPKKRLILICVDGSEHSTRAFEWFYYNVYNKDDTVGIVHIHCVPDAPALGLFGGGLAALELYKTEVNKSIKTSKAVVEKYENLCSEKGINPKLFVESMQDSVGHTVCKLAKENAATLIVMAQRGLGAIRRTLIGSVSDYVIHHTHIPVTVVTTLDS